MRKSDGNIIICDASALHLHLHSDGPSSIRARKTPGNPLEACAATAEGLTNFNTEHPLYGGQPVDVLVSSSRNRRVSKTITARCCNYELPGQSFWQLRSGLFITSPQLTFVRMAHGRPISQIAEAGLNLCARYYLNGPANAIADRSSFLVTPRELKDYIASAPNMRGVRKAELALTWVAPNSGSPMETKTWLQFVLPYRHGGFGMRFDALNHAVSAGRLSSFTSQHDFSIDLACVEKRFGLEYDGLDYHQDVGNDKRRRNELAVLGWKIFPIDKDILYDAEATQRTARQVAHQLGHRLQMPRGWEARFARLRQELGLPN